MIKTILRALGFMKAPAKPVEPVSIGGIDRSPQPHWKNSAEPAAKPQLRTLKLEEHPGLDLLALQARSAKNKQNGKRHHKTKVAPRPHRF